ncbi:NTE family protein RssA [Vibrio mangrovi]|nr:NTE family protein RssA [Vibrio mangrovi]
MMVILLWWGIAPDVVAKSRTQVQQSRPRIAVVLAGGGAKGAAHIGVLKALEELRVPIDYITGTSMGAYIGGFYATGIPAQQLHDEVMRVDWNQGYRDRVDRSLRRVRDKEFEDRYQLNTDLGIRWIEIRAPKGVIQGQNMLRLLRETVGNLPRIPSFAQLPIPYRAVATDIVNLKPVELKSGSLIDAMMASMSVPGALPPYEVDGQLLVDGGVTDNMPVDVARKMGADTVIAVDISTDYKQQTDFTDFLTVTDQLSNYLVRQSTQRQADSLTPHDIYLKPDVGQMETTEFDRMADAYQKGYQAVMDQRQAFAALSLPEEDYQRYVAQKRQKAAQLQAEKQWVFARIELENQTHYRDSVLKQLLAIPAEAQVSQEEIEARIEALYALDRFELIRYRIESQDKQDILVVSVREKSWGPNYVNFHFALEDDFASQSLYSVGVSTNFTGLNSLGSEVRVDMEMGSNRKIFAEYYAPITQDQKVFSTLSVNYRKDDLNVPQSGFENIGLGASKDYLPATYTVTEGEVALGYQYRLWDEFKFGLRFGDGDASYSTLPSYGDMDFERRGVFARYRVDTLDSYTLPNHGFFLNLDYLVSDDQVAFSGALDQDDYHTTVYEYSITLKGATQYGRHTLIGNAEYGEVKSSESIAPISPKTIGGLLNLSGIPRDSLLGQNKAFTSLVYRYRWFDNDFGLFTSPVYLGVSLEYGGVWSDPSVNLRNAPLYHAGSLFAGIDSPLGPVMVGYGRTQQNYDSVYVSVGYAF